MIFLEYRAPPGRRLQAYIGRCGSQKALAYYVSSFTFIMGSGVPLGTCNDVMKGTYLKDQSGGNVGKGGGRVREGIKESAAIFQEIDGLLCKVNRGMTKTLLFITVFSVLHIVSITQVNLW